MTEKKPPSDGGGGGFTLAFNIGKPKAPPRTAPLVPKKKVDEEEKEYIVSISDTGIQSSTPVTNAPLVIPLIDNVGQAKNTTTAPQTAERPATSHDLQLHEPGLHKLNGTTKQSDSVEGIENSILLRNRNPILQEIEDEQERFRKDVELRPEEADLEAYERMPVEAFGEAMLRGMDWVPGQPLGRNKRGLVEPVVFIPRHHRLGLGAKPKAPDPEKKKKKKGYFPKPGEEAEKEKPMMMMPLDANGRRRHVVKLSELEKLVPVEYVPADSSPATDRRGGDKHRQEDEEGRSDAARRDPGRDRERDKERERHRDTECDRERDREFESHRRHDRGGKHRERERPYSRERGSHRDRGSDEKR